MKSIISFILQILLFISSYAQIIDYEDIKLNGLSFYSSEPEILNQLGTPKRIFKPNYECGFLSEDEQGTSFFTIEYHEVAFTGNKNDKYLIDEINFAEGNNLILTYRGKKIPSNITISQLENILGVKIPKKTTKQRRVYCDFSFGENSAEGLLFVFEEEKLIKVLYWSSC